MKNEQDTIVAIATPPGASAIAIVRLSGPESLKIADALFDGHADIPSKQQARIFLHGKLRYSPESAAAPNRYIDDVILLIFRAPHSYTGEDVVEIQCHGGTWTTQAILRAICAQGARIAAPGEFTRRAFLSGKMDLVQAEAVIDLINAKNEKAARAAIEQMDGRLSIELSALYDKLLSLSAELEASLDFDENAMPDNYKTLINSKIHVIRANIVTLLATWDEGRMIREGALVIISGGANVGKSTLMNKMLGFRRAIVADMPGTTRDTLEESIIIHGFPCRLVDTAGLRETTCFIEKEGIERTRDYLARGDVVLYMVDGSQPMTDEDRVIIDTIQPDRLILIVNKSDLGLHHDIVNNDYKATKIICSITNEDISQILSNAIFEKISRFTTSFHGAYISERLRELLVISKNEIDAITDIQQFQQDQWIALTASCLRQATTIIGEALGKTYYNDMLDRIFSKFCVGK